MPINYADRRVVWSCTACEEQDGKTQCSYAKHKVTYKRKIIKATKRTIQNIQRQNKEKTTGRVEGVPKYVTQFIENDLRGRIVTTHG
jgi:hypothetical protein